MDIKKNNGPMSTVEGAKISVDKVVIWAKDAVIRFTDTTVTTTDRMHTSGSSDRSAIGINNTRVLRKQNVMEWIPPLKILKLLKSLMRPTPRCLILLSTLMEVTYLYVLEADRFL